MHRAELPPEKDVAGHQVTEAREDVAGHRVTQARESVEKLRRKSLYSILALGVSGLGAATTATLGARALTVHDRVAAVTFFVPAVVLALVAAAQLVVIFVYSDKIRIRELTIATEEEAGELEHAGGKKNLGPFMAFSHRQMTRFECVAVGQAHAWHRASLLAAALGFVVLAAGAWVTVTRDNLGDTVTGAVMTGVGTALSGFLSATFLRTFRETMEQMSYYYGQPSVNCYLLHAERLLERSNRGLDDATRHEDSQKMIDAILHAAKDAQSHLLDMDAQRLPHRRWQAPRPMIKLPSQSPGSASRV
jgi:hypothetical protein